MTYINPDSALTPANIYVEATQSRFSDSYRRWQGIPSIEVTGNGRIFVNFYSGQDAEVGGNIMVLCVSDNHGESFRSCVTVVEHPDPNAGSMILIYGSLQTKSSGCFYTQARI